MMSLLWCGLNIMGLAAVSLHLFVSRLHTVAMVVVSMVLFGQSQYSERGCSCTKKFARGGSNPYLTVPNMAVVPDVIQHVGVEAKELA